jgi:putative addiction module component (TIGR02574 family)
MDMLTAMDAVRQWPVVDQIEFVQRVWDQLAEAGWRPELTEAQKCELDRRLAEHEANPANVLTWDDVETFLRRQR